MRSWPGSFIAKFSFPLHILCVSQSAAVADPWCPGLFSSVIQLCSVTLGDPFVGAAEDLDQIPVDFLPEPSGPLRSLLNSRGPVRFLSQFIERHHLQPEAEDAAQGGEGCHAGSGAPPYVADRVGVAGSESRDLSFGESGLVDEIEEALSHTHARNRSSPGVPLTGIVSSAKKEGVRTDEASNRHRERGPVAGLAPRLHHHRMRPVVQKRVSNS